MTGLSPDAITGSLSQLPVEAVEGLMLCACFSAPLLFLRAFGRTGLYVHITVAILAANVQVTKTVLYAVFPDPVALGTVVFASTYLASDMLTEHYGRAAARTGVMIGFAAYLFWTVLAVLALGYRPAGESAQIQDHLAAVFSPAPALFAAGMLSYLTSQLGDIWIFQRVRRITGRRHLWLRTNASTMVSALIDNTIFSLLAWRVFAAEPVGWHALIWTYILGTYALRLLYSVLDTPFMYLSRRMVRHAPDYVAADAA